MPKRPDSKKDIHYFSLSSDALINSCPIPKLHVKKGNSADVLAVEAQVTMKLSEYLKKAKGHMEYNHVEKMIHCIGNQLKKLEAKEYGIPSFNLDDITVFFILKPETKRADSESDDEDDDKSSGKDKDIIYDSNYDIYFAITNDDKVFTFDNNYTHEVSLPSSNPIHDQQLLINSPLKQEYIIPTSSYQKNKVFISPEFEKFTKTKELPYHIHFKSGYYSFGLLCIYCFLTKKNITFAREDIKNKVFKELDDCLYNEDEEELNKTKTKAKLNPNPNQEILSVTYVLQTILNTKIYWFLIRVLNRTPSARQYICV